jgi:hypothetical protein
MVYKSSSSASIIEAVDQLKNGAEVMMLSAELMRDRITNLEKANEAATRRKQREKSLPREMERICSLNKRLSTKLLVNSVKMKSNRASAVRLWRAARGAERLGTSHARVKKTF